MIYSMFSSLNSWSALRISMESPCSICSCLSWIRARLTQIRYILMFLQVSRVSQSLHTSNIQNYWANSSTSHLKLQHTGSTFLFLSYIHKTGSISFRVEFIRFTFPYIPSLDLSMSTMCRSITSAKRLFKRKKQLYQSMLFRGLWLLTVKKIGARIQFIPWTYPTLGLSLEQMKRIRDMWSWIQLMRCQPLSCRNLEQLFQQQDYLNFSLRAQVRQGMMMVALVFWEKKLMLERVRVTSFQICSHNSQSFTLVEYSGWVLSKKIGQSGYSSAFINFSTNSEYVCLYPSCTQFHLDL